MLFSISLSLVSCGDGGDDNGDDTGEVGGNEGGNEGGNNDGGNGSPDADDPVTPVIFTTTENYLPADVFTEVYDSFAAHASSFDTLDISKAPFAYTDVFTVSDARVKSITIPVMATGAQDENGCYVFTMYKVRNSYAGICGNRLVTYTVTVNAQQYGLSDDQSGLYKAITVDLTSYDIALDATETLSFGSKDDTIIPAVLNHNNMTSAPIATVNDKFPQAIGVFNNDGKLTTSPTSQKLTLCFDLQLERSFATEAERDAYAGREAEYDRIVAALKDIYAGKNISVLGDSISTFEGITSNPSYNLTLAVNQEKTPNYPTYDKTTSDYTKTYWGRLLTELEMNLCVANAISGGFVSNSSSDAGDPFQDRAGQLHRDNKTPNNRADDTNPDVIIVYQGINDVDNERSTGNLITQLKKNDGLSDIQKVAIWFNDVLANYKGDGSWVNFDAAYALGLYNMLEKYPGVEIYCVTLVKNYSPKLSTAALNNYNRVIKAIAEYFGATIIDQNGALSEYSTETFYAYTALGEAKAIHPKSAGHLALERLIVMTMAEKHGLI